MECRGALGVKTTPLHQFFETRKETFYEYSSGYPGARAFFFQAFRTDFRGRRREDPWKPLRSKEALKYFAIHISL